MSTAIVATMNGRAKAISSDAFVTATVRSLDSSNGESTKENTHALTVRQEETQGQSCYAEREEVLQPFKDSTVERAVEGSPSFLLAKNPKDCHSPKRRPMSKKQSAVPDDMINLTPRTDLHDDHLQLDTVSIISHQSSMGSSVVGVNLVETPVKDGLSLPQLYSEPKQVSQNHYPYILSSPSTISSKGSHRPGTMNEHIPSALNYDPDQDEQMMFEQRLCEDEYGVAVRKVASNGKSQLRYVRCVFLRLKDKNRTDAGSLRSGDSLSFQNPNHPPEELNMAKNHQPSVGSKSASSIIHRMKLRKSNNSTSNEVLDISQVQNGYQRALVWGSKKRAKVPLDKFVCVRKGKTTDRTRRNTCSSVRLLSIITKDRRNPSLDIEAPTKLDRDKFARAFARFLNVPLEEDPETRTDASTVSMDILQTSRTPSSKRPISAAHSAPGSAVPTTPMSYSSSSVSSSICTPQQDGPNNCTDLLPAISPSLESTEADNRFIFDAQSPPILPKLKDPSSSSKKPSSRTSSKNSGNILSDAAMKRVTDNGPDLSCTLPSSLQMVPTQAANANGISNPNMQKQRRKSKTKDETPAEPDVDSEVSSITQGYDQEIIEELHNAINELRAELDASRAEAARAVKVAEQAIQSAESCSSNDWNNTVTHKAAEAAAQAQKRSAEAMARQRLAEERLAEEKKSARFWRKQAETAEDEIGALQTRVAAAEIHRTKVSEEMMKQKKLTSTYIYSLKRDFSMGEKIQRETISGAAERNRLLEIELDGTRRDLVNAEAEMKSLQEVVSEIKNNGSETNRGNNRKSFFGLHKKKKDARGPALLAAPRSSFKSDVTDESLCNKKISIDTDNELLLKLHAEATATRKQFELLRRSTVDELRSLPEQAKEWSAHITRTLMLASKENETLRMEFAKEKANRRKLLNEVQDLRGTVRVYCRPTPISADSNDSIISTPSHEICLLHREKILGAVHNNMKPINPLTYEFDRVFEPHSSQSEVYSEMEELILSALDGYNICILAFGQNGSGKTHTLIGDYSVDFSNGKDVLPDIEIQEDGMHILAAQQLFTIADRRKERYQDSFSITIVEVHNEKLRDLVAGTNLAKQRGQRKGYEGKSQKDGNGPETASSSENKGGKSGNDDNEIDDVPQNKLEIQTNYDGDTVVKGLLSIPVNNFEEVEQVWNETLATRALRCKEQGIDLKSLEATSHVIATIQVVSTNIASGVGTVGKIQFVDLAGAEICLKRSGTTPKSKTSSLMQLPSLDKSNEFKFTNRSLNALADVVYSRSQYTRKVPYRNSTLTHLLRDSLEADTKMLCIVCVSSNKRDIEETACSLRFASYIKKVVVGKATKHTVSLA